MRLPLGAPVTQRAQYPLIKEYSLNQKYEGPYHLRYNSLIEGYWGSLGRLLLSTFWTRGGRLWVAAQILETGLLLVPLPILTGVKD